MTENRYGKNVFVTGASSGIGKACAEFFAMRGCHVTGVSRHCEEGAKEFPGGGSLSMKRLDITDEDAVRSFVKDLPGLDIAILCAGIEALKTSVERILNPEPSDYAAVTLIIVSAALLVKILIGLYTKNRGARA